MSLRIVRTTVLSLCTILAIVVLGLAARLLSVSHNRYRFSSNAWASLAIATSTITIVSLPVLIITGLFHASMALLAVELIWLFIVWVLWVSTAADTARFNRTFFSGSCNFRDGFVRTACREVRTVEAFAFIIWVILLAYFIGLLVYAIFGRTRGETAGASSVKRGTAAAPVGGQPPNQQGQGTQTPTQMTEHPAQGTQPGVQGHVNV